MDVSISMIVDSKELDKMLENTNLDEFKLNDSLREYLDGSLQENTGIGSVPNMDTDSTLGLAPTKGSNVELHSGVDPCQGSSLSPPGCFNSWWYSY